MNFPQMVKNNLWIWMLLSVLALLLGFVEGTPEQVFISLHPSEPRTMFVSWVDKVLVQQPYVRIWWDNPQLDLYIHAVNRTSYTLSDQNYTSPNIYTATIPNLTPSRVYFYQVGSDGPSKIFSFKANPDIQDSEQPPVVISVVGDVGATDNSRSMVASVMAHGDANLTIHTGDLSYADTEGHNQTIWDIYGSIIEPMAANTPYQVAVGNHEAGEDFIPYSSRYSTKFFQENSRPVGGDFYYYFRYTNIHFLSLSSETDFSQNSAQFKFLAATLQKITAQAEKEKGWIILFFHQPWYSSNEAGDTRGREMRVQMEKLVEAFPVDIIFCGHVHAYERMARIRNGQVTQNAPMYITVGDGGNPEGLATKWVEPQPEWSIFRKSEWGYGRLKVFNTTTAQFEWWINGDLSGPHDLVTVQKRYK